MKEINAAMHQLTRANKAPTHRVTVMPLMDSATPRERKDACRHQLGHLGEALKRRGYPHVAVTFFEHPHEADLHAHQLVHVPRGAGDILARFHRPPEVCVETLREHRGGLHGAVAYATKERQRLSPDFEKSINRPWRSCRPVPGKRWSLTGDAKVLLHRENTETESRPTPAKPEFCEALKRDDVEPVQLALPLVAPVIDVGALVEAKRQEMGISQAAAARRIGIRQPHYSNSIVRHHDPLSPWALNRARDFIADRLAA